MAKLNKGNRDGLKQNPNENKFVEIETTVVAPIQTPAVEEIKESQKPDCDRCKAGFMIPETANSKICNKCQKRITVM